MTQHVKIELDEQQLQAAQKAAHDLGVTVETYLTGLISSHLPVQTQDNRADISSLFGLIPFDAGEPTDIARDKDRLVGEAVWAEYLRETKQH